MRLSLDKRGDYGVETKALPLNIAGVEDKRLLSESGFSDTFIAKKWDVVTNSVYEVD